MNDTNEKLAETLNVFCSKDLMEYSNVREEVENTLNNILPYRLKKRSIISGSFGSGILNHSDIDVMGVDNSYFGYDDCTFIIDTTDCYPGYTKFYCTDTRLYCDAENHHQDFDSEGYLCFNNLNTMVNNRRGWKMHGPAAQIHDIDYVYSIPSKKWLKQFDFLRRNNLPKLYSLDEMKNIGYHLVPVAHPKSKDPDRELRFSFSCIENYMLKKWPLKLQQVYFLFKDVNSSYLKENEILIKGICTYHAKTVILWAVEEKPKIFWENSFLQIIEVLLLKLKNCIQKKILPNYFISSNNMFSCFTDDQVSQLLVQLNNVIENLKHSIFSCICMKAWRNQSLDKERIKNLSFEAHYFILAVFFNVEDHKLLNCLEVLLQWENQISSQLDINLFRTFYIGVQRFLCAKLLAGKMNKYSGAIVEDILLKSIDMPAIYSDYGISGKTLLALFYCKIKKYEESEVLLKEVLSAYSKYV